MKKFKITLWFENKKQEVIWPDFFEEKSFIICYTKDQFDFYKDYHSDHNFCFFDFKKKRIYFHEFFTNYYDEDSLDMSYECSHKVFEMKELAKEELEQ